MLSYLKKGDLMRFAIFFLVLFSLLLGCSSNNNKKKFAAQNTSLAGIRNGVELKYIPQKEATVALKDEGDDFYCTGSYIGNNKVVTAAHCDKKNFKTSFVEFQKDGKFNKCKITDYKLHEDYKSISKEELPQNDIAVLKIDCEDFDLNMIEHYLLNNDDLFRERINIAGFGTDQSDETTYPNLITATNNNPMNEKSISRFKKEVKSSLELANQVPDPEQYVLSVKSIEEWVLKQYERVKEGKLNCYFVSKKRLGKIISAGKGDSGGPQFYINSDSKHVLSGVTSGGTLGEGNLMELLYPNFRTSCNTNTSYFLNWINQF
jgi:secreted trypsin-like serine protease